MGTYATADEILVRLRRPEFDEGEQQQFEAWIEEAETLVRGRLPRLAQLIADGTIQAGSVTLAVHRAVTRVALNPEGWRVEGFDDSTGTRDATLSTGQVYLSGDEWALIMPWLSGAGLPTAYTLTLGTPCEE